MRAVTLFVVNPISGDHDKADTISTIKSWSQSSKEKIEIWKTTGKNDKENLELKVKEIQPHKVVAVGGDGTVLLCASILMHTSILLGILPMGSANGMSTELQIPQNLNMALDVIGVGRYRKSDMLLFNSKDLGIHISDIGLNAGLVKQFEEGQRRGFLGYAKGIVGELSDLNSFNIRIETDRETLETEGYMVAFGNAKRYGTGALLNNDGNISDGLLELSILHSIDLPSIAGHFFEIINKDSKHMHTIQCTKAKITTDREMPFQIDGELQQDTNQVIVEIIPRCLHLIIPE